MPQQHGAPVADAITPAEATELLRSERVQLIDVREPWEAAIVSIDGSKLVPLGTLERSLEQLDRDQPVLVYCHHGVRSARALALLRHHGFTQASHLAGGIDAYAVQVDPTLARY